MFFLIRLQCKFNVEINANIVVHHIVRLSFTLFRIYIVCALDVIMAINCNILCNPELRCKLTCEIVTRTKQSK